VYCECVVLMVDGRIGVRGNNVEKERAEWRSTMVRFHLKGLCSLNGDIMHDTFLVQVLEWVL